MDGCSADVAVGRRRAGPTTDDEGVVRITSPGASAIDAYTSATANLYPYLYCSILVYWPLHTCTHTHRVEHIFVDFLTSSRRPPFRSIIHGESLQTRRNVLMGNAHTYIHTHVYTSHLHQRSPSPPPRLLASNAFQHVLIPNKCNPK